MKINSAKETLIMTYLNAKIHHLLQCQYVRKGQRSAVRGQLSTVRGQLSIVRGQCVRGQFGAVRGQCRASCKVP